MNAADTESLRQELISRGFDKELQSPHGSLHLGTHFLQSRSLGDVFECLVALRAKWDASSVMFTQESDQRLCNDLSLAIAATKVAIERRVTPATTARLFHELVSRGFRQSQHGLDAPQASMGFTDSLLDDVVNLFEMMLVRQEKIIKMVDSIGLEAVVSCFADVAATISAIKAALAEREVGQA